MTVMATVSAPGEFFGNLTKANIRRKDVYLSGVNWETANFICTNEECRYIYAGYGNYISKLEKKCLLLDDFIELLESYETNSSLTDSHTLELFLRLSQQAKDYLQ
jgi:hypothetical protein